MINAHQKLYHTSRFTPACIRIEAAPEDPHEYEDAVNDNLYAHGATDDQIDRIVEDWQEGLLTDFDVTVEVMTRAARYHA